MSLIFTMRKKLRVFWALNHVTLVKSECALLEKLGFEVLTPKVCPAEILERSGSVDYSYDHTLTIPAEDLAALNACDFYASQVDPAAMDLLNQHFDVVLVAFNLPMLQNFHDHFRGIIVLRAFGREQKKTYGSALEAISFKKTRLARLRDRLLGRDTPQSLLDKLVSRNAGFFFGGCYREVNENEQNRLQAIATFLPLGLPSETWAQADTWTGGDDRVMFVCPCVHHPYYGDIYRSFKSEMDGLPFSVYGNQAPNHADDKLVGFLPRDEYDDRMRRHAVMFYHSSEPCHLHYHPLEAVAMGVPLIYMDGGMLARMGGSDQPGLCRSTQEAKEKLRRILDGDHELIARIRAAQPRILDEFRGGFVEEAWRRGFLPLLEKRHRRNYFF